MRKQVSAHQAFAKSIELARKPRRVMFINQCPDCLGIGKINTETCPTCGNEPDDPTGLIKRNGRWYKVTA